MKHCFTASAIERPFSGSERPARQGLIERDAENSYLNLDGFNDDEAGAMPDLYGHSITYRIALGPQRGKKVFSLQTLLPHTTEGSHARLAKAAGFSLHGGVAARAAQRYKLERPGGDPLAATSAGLPSQRRGCRLPAAVRFVIS